MSARRLVRSSAAALALLVGLAGALLASCGSGPSTPEELFERIVAAMNAGRPGVVYDLLSTEEKARWDQAVRNNKETTLKNPGARGRLVTQYQMTFEEFQRATPAQVWDRAHSNMELVLRGARVVDKTTDPVLPTDVWLTFETTGKQRFRWIMREEPGRGWTLQKAEAVKLE